jgi:formylglycine-generating enzyme required for sulfatase activity
MRKNKILAAFAFVLLPIVFLASCQKGKDPLPTAPPTAMPQAETVGDKPATGICPTGMVFVPGGETEVIYSGARWGGAMSTVSVTKTIADFCIDKYEASKPDATATFAGRWNTGIGEEPPPAQSKAGVLPWFDLTWAEAKRACENAQKQLPTLAQWQTAYSGHTKKTWPWGDMYQKNSCYIDRPGRTEPFPTGGCCFTQCKGDVCFETCDMVGHMAEWVSDLWDENCYGKTERTIAGGGMGPYEIWNGQIRAPNKPGCWKFDGFGHTRWGIHHHPTDLALDDDGFRCAKPLP